MQKKTKNKTDTETEQRKRNRTTKQMRLRQSEARTQRFIPRDAVRPATSSRRSAGQQVDALLPPAQNRESEGQRERERDKLTTFDVWRCR